MWWSPEVSRKTAILSRTRDAVEQLLGDAGLRRGDDGLWTDAGHAIGIARSPAGLFVGWIDVGWASSEDPFSELRDVSHLATITSPDRLTREVAIALEEATTARAEHLRECEICTEQFLPGQMYDAACCHSCATREHGITF